MKLRLLIAFGLVAAHILSSLPAFAVSARSGHGTMTVTPTIVSAESTNNYSFKFRANRNSFDPGSQVTLRIPLQWPPPQTTNPAAPGFVKLTPFAGSTSASLASIGGSGPWVITVDILTVQSQAGFTLDYLNSIAPSNGGVYTFTAQSRQSGGQFRTLRSGSPSVTVNNLNRTNTTTTITSSLNPSVYGDWVTFSAAVTGASTNPVTGTLTFLNGDEVIASVTLDAAGKASASTNRFSVPDAPASITALYSGDTNYNGSVSQIYYQDVQPRPVTVAGLVAQSKIYDGNSQASVDVSNASFDGMLTGDDLSLIVTNLVATFASPTVGADKAVTVSGLLLGGLDGEQYIVNSWPTLSSSIWPAPLTVTADDKVKPFGSPNPPLTVSYTGFVAGETASVLSGTPVLTTTAVLSSTPAAGPYPIQVTAGTLTAANYYFVFVPGWLSVEAGAPQPHQILSVAALPEQKISLLCAGTPGERYVIESTTDLLNGTWSGIATNQMDYQGLMTFVDERSTTEGNRFFRLVLP